MKRLLIYIVLICLAAGISCGANAHVDHVRFYFRFGHSRYEPGIRDNDIVMRKFLEEVRRQDEAGNIGRIIVRSFTSPDGVSTANRQLSVNRCRSIEEYIVSATGISPLLVVADPEGIAWDELRRMVVADERVPCRDDVLRILDDVPVWVYDSEHHIVGSRKKSLMDLEGGIAYRWMRENLFPYLHSATVVLQLKDSSAAYWSEVYARAECSDSISYAMAPFPGSDETAGHGRSARKRKSRYNDNLRYPLRRFALKTNLAYALALMPSLELECRISRCWSFNLEGDVAWWKNREGHKCYQLAMVSPEVRFWFGGNSLRGGLYAGAFAGAGLYDLENVTRGYRGEGLMAGLSFGYLWPLTRGLAIETGIGGGWMSTRYQEYVPYEGHHIYVRSRKMDYYGPLKVKVALVWRLGGIGLKHEGGGTR